MTDLRNSQMEVNQTLDPLLTGDTAGEESDALEVEAPDGPEHVALAEGPVGAQQELNETLRVGEADRRAHRHGRHERQRVQL